MIFKHKIYVRRWRCASCGEPVIATYNFTKKVWSLKCACGVDETFKSISRNKGAYALESKGIYPID